VPANIAPLRHRSFRLLWSAGAISDIGTWIQLATIGTLLTATGSSVTSVALVYGATFVPQTICAPLGGVLADRQERRRLFLSTLFVQTVATGLLAFVIATGERRAAVLGLFVLIQAAAGSLGQPALSAVLPDLVPKEELTAAVALGLTAWNTGRVVGPLLAWILSPLGSAGAIGFNALSFAVLWFAVFRMSRRFHPAPRQHDSIVAELADGARNTFRAKGVVQVVAISILLHLTYIPFMGVVPAKAKHILGFAKPLTIANKAMLQRTVGILMSCQGLGAIFGSMAAAPLLLRFKRSSIIRAAVALGATTCVLYGWNQSLLFVAPFIALLGATSALIFSQMGGIVQRDAPPEHRGRVLSWYFGSMGVTYGVGLFSVGAITDSIGISRALSLLASITLIAVAAVGVTKRWRTNLDRGDDHSKDPGKGHRNGPGKGQGKGPGKGSRKDHGADPSTFGNEAHGPSDIVDSPATLV
jgi:MFS family permease